MTERWRKLAELFEQAAALPPESQAAWLDRIDDPSLRDELRAMLAAAPSAETFFETPTGPLSDLLSLLRGEHLTGESLGGWVLDEPLARGGMGVAYRAHRGHDVAAIKVIPIGEADSRWRVRAERESQVLARVEHPNVVRILGSGVSGSFFYLVMDLVDGGNLRQLPLPQPVERVIDLASQLAAALAAVARSGVVHRDVKPENVLLTASGSVKLADFGLARERPREPGSPTVSLHDGTMGTVNYLAPEQVRGEVVDTAVDIWALGAIMAELLTGQVAFQRSTPLATASAILQDSPPALPSHTPVELARLIRACLDKNAARRPTANQVAERLAALPSAGVLTLGTRRKRYAAGAAAAVAVCAGLWSALPPAEPPSWFVQPLATHREIVAEPAYSADGRSLVYASPSDTRKGFDLWLQAPGGAARALTNGFDNRQPSLSPDGGSIVFRSTRQPAGLYRLEVANGQLRLLAPDGRGGRFSPDGRWIAYWVAHRPVPGGKGPSSSLWLLSTQGGPARQVASAVSDARSPVWAPDSRRLLFAGRQSLLALTLATGALEQISPLPLGSEPLLWRPERDEVILRASQDPDRSLRRLTHGRFDSLPYDWCALGPNGLVVADSHSENRLWWTPSRGGPHAPRILTPPGNGSQSRPWVSRHGNQVAFQRGGRWEVVDLAQGAAHAPVASAPPDTPIRFLDANAWDVLRDGTRALLPGGNSPVELRLVRPDGPPRTVVSHPDLSVYLASLSPDEREIVFTAESSTAAPRVYRAPFRPGGPPVSPSEWLELGPGDYPRWDPNGGGIYLLHQGQVFRQPLPAGPRERVVDLSQNPGFQYLAPQWFRLAVSRDRLIFPLATLQGRLFSVREEEPTLLSRFTSLSPLQRKGVNQLMKPIYALLGLLSVTTGAHGAIYSAVADFNNTGTQAGSNWTYGTASTVGGGLTLFSTYGTHLCGTGGFPLNLCEPANAPIEEWIYDAPLLGPVVARNVSGGTIGLPSLPSFFPTGILLMTTGGSDIGRPNVTVVRFTNPTAGVYNLAGSFTDQQSSTVDLYVSINNSPVAQSFGSFSFSNLNLAAGATVDFIVDARGNRDSDVVGLQATLTSVPSGVPEPSTMAMVGGAVAAALAAARLRRR